MHSICFPLLCSYAKGEKALTKLNANKSQIPTLKKNSASLGLEITAQNTWE